MSTDSLNPRASARGAVNEAERHRALREAKKAMKARYGIPCPECVAALPKAPPPRVLLPGELCKTHGYRDPRPRTPENDYQLIGSGAIRFE